MYISRITHNSRVYKFVADCADLPCFSEIETEDLRNKRAPPLPRMEPSDFPKYGYYKYTRLVSSRYKSIGRPLTWLDAKGTPIFASSLIHACAWFFLAIRAAIFAHRCPFAQKANRVRRYTSSSRHDRTNGWIYLLAHSGVRLRSFHAWKKSAYSSVAWVYMNIFIRKLCW